MKDLTKRFWLFCYPNNYPKGGLEDIVKTSDCLDKLIELSYSDNYYIFDSENKNIVYDDMGKFEIKE